MEQTVFILLFAIPAILGLAEIIHTCRLWLCSARRLKGKVVVVVARNDDFSCQLLGVAESFKWYGSSFAQRVIVLDDLLTEENRFECERLAKKLNLEMSCVKQLQENILDLGR